jgi:gliding motility-associated protein GldL
MANFTHGKKWKKFMAKLYGWGAALVIVGALFKIQHYEGAGIMLVIGLSTEAIIFFFSAFEPLPHEYDWSLVYPEFGGMFDEDEKKEKKTKKIDPITQELDKLLSEAKIGPELIQSLGVGLKNLGDNTSKLADLTDASLATNDYVKNVKNASKSVGDLNESYVKAANVMGELSAAGEDVKIYNSQMSNAAKNLGALNAIYEMQLQGSNEHLKATSKMYEGMNVLMNNLNDSISDTKKYKDEISSLAKNLSALNNVYGNMLSAMSGGSKN